PSQREAVHVLKLLPNESVPFFTRKLISKPGQFELAVNYAHYLPTSRSYIHVRAWKTIEVPLPQQTATPKPLTIHATVTTELSGQDVHGGWSKLIKIEGQLINDTGDSRYLFAMKWPAELVKRWGAERVASWGLCLPGQILLFGQNGELVAGHIEWSTDG